MEHKIIKLSLLIATILPVSCGSASQKDVCFTMLVNNEQMKNEIVSILERYNQNSGHNIKIDYVVNSGEPGPGNTKFDLFFDDINVIKKQYIYNQIEALDSQHCLSLIERENPVVLQLFSKDNKILSYPVGIRFGVSLFYNKSLLSASDTSSWSGIISKNSSLELKHNFGMNFFSGTELFGAFSGNGLNTYSDENGIVDNINSDDGLEIAKALSLLFSKAEFTFLNRSLQQNDDYIAIAGPSMMDSVYKDYFGDDFAISSLPNFERNEKSYKWSNTFNTVALSIANNERSPADKKTLFDLAEYLTNIENQEVLLSCLDGHYYPTNKNNEQSIASSQILLDQLLTANDYAGYPIEWYHLVEKLFADIRNDNGMLNDDSLKEALDDYHNNVLKLAF